MTRRPGLFDFFWEPNAPRWDRATFDRKDAYDLAVIEFDDQGWYHKPESRNALEAHLRQFEAEDLAIFVFIHGWRHNAAATDDNLHSFRSLLRDAAKSEIGRTHKKKILGIYIGWRGLSLHGMLSYATFYTRMSTAFRVAVGSVREILALVRRHQRERNRNLSDEQIEQGLGTRLVLAGHSFGALVLFSAVAEYLIESIARPKKVVRPFGDLIILVNPAFEATRYQPLVTAALARGGYPSGQRVCFMAVTAANDWATGITFPIGRWFGTWFEAVRRIKIDGITDHAQRDANLNTIGHIKWLRTHRLTAPVQPAAAPATAKYEGRKEGPDLAKENADFTVFNEQWRRDGVLQEHWERTYSDGAHLQHVAGDASNPFWIVEASKEVVDGHNGIFRPVFLDFLRQLADDRMRRAI
ncbi:hypothetical protein NKI54_29715 [Mesorhizobium sp. M0663]|uniref:hypothetical protein n=1 Tax=Mesorhizobium sp. M0663 TaxID=2956981 RepID=UPI003337751E